MAIREGRLKVPATGTFRQGSLITFDPANLGAGTQPSLIKAAADGQIGEGGTVGLLVQEDSHISSVFGAEYIDTFSSRYGVAKNGVLTTLWCGAGTKVWFRNTAAQTRSDGRVIAAVNMVDFTDVVALGYLTWTGTVYAGKTGAAAAATAANSMFRVTALDAAAGYLEATLIR